MIQKIFLDVDGILRDFDMGARQWHHLPLERSRSWEAVMEEYNETLGLDPYTGRKMFWGGLTETFWSYCPKTPWCDDVLSALMAWVAAGRVTLLTSPAVDTAGSTQKWIRRNLPYFWANKHYLIGPDKAACAHPYAVLIDDHEKNVEAFRNAGGQTILFPAPHNWNHYRFDNDPVDYMKLQLQRMACNV
jgi:hypothetical protein